jgi:hypothetical protein
VAKNSKNYFTYSNLLPFVDNEKHSFCKVGKLEKQIYTILTVHVEAGRFITVVVHSRTCYFSYFDPTLRSRIIFSVVPPPEGNIHTAPMPTVI